ncbi:Ff.00g132740.m01.CDS01 [Fusarium sp. VM40]|nr:Ff.00g132740.m01.CDS01 [Fusarium sp. VM40]
MSEKSKAAFNNYTEPEAASAAPPPFAQAVQGGPSPVPRSRFASITRNGLDRIRLIHFSEVEMAAIHEVIRSNWEQGIDKVYPGEESREIKLKGYAWGYDFNGNEEAILLVLRLLEALFNMGWMLYSPIEVTKRVSTKDALIFRQQNHIPHPCEWISISFHGGDKLKILNHPPPDLSAEVIATFITDIQKHEVTPERTKIKFKKFPWGPTGYDDVESQLKLMALLEVVERYGFTLYARTTARYSGETSESSVLVFQRRRDWVPGTPLYH